MAARRGFAPLLGVILIGIVALGSGVFFSLQQGSEQRGLPEGLTATYLTEGKPLPEFGLIDHHGQAFDRARFEGQWSLLFFGFTHCPDICPGTLLEMSTVKQALSEAGLSEDVGVIFVTVDPLRDDADRLKAYVTNFDHRFLGVTGELKDIDVLTQALGIVHIRHGEPGSVEYSVDHSSSVLLINPQAQLQAVFRAPQRADIITPDMLQILRHHEGA